MFVKGTKSGRIPLEKIRGNWQTVDKVQFSGEFKAITPDTNSTNIWCMLLAIQLHKKACADVTAGHLIKLRSRINRNKRVLYF